MKLSRAILRSAYRRDPRIVAQNSSIRVYNPRIVPRNEDNYVDSRTHQYACMLHDYDYSTTAGWVEELEIEEVGRRIFERQ